LMFGIFVCSSILPDFAVVLMGGQIRARFPDPQARPPHASMVQFRRAVIVLHKASFRESHWKPPSRSTAHVAAIGTALVGKLGALLSAQ
jgi:hypothetical protein